MKVTPHVAQNKSGRRSAVADEIAQSEGYAISQRKRKLIEQGLGWAGVVGPIRQVMVRGIKKAGQLFLLTMAAYNLVRMRTLARSVRWRRRGSERERRTRLRSGKTAIAANPERRNLTTAIFSPQDEFGTLGTSAAC